MTMNELELVKLYAKAWNTLDFKLIEPHLAEDFLYGAQAVDYPELKGEKAKRYVQSKMERKRFREEERVFAEIGYFPSDYPSWGLAKINFQKNFWGYPCILMARGSKDNLVCPVILEIKDHQIQSVYMCAVPPIQNVFRTGEYPG